jgi:outer membrane protein OmpA-like peptidoglycan-associated protein
MGVAGGAAAIAATIAATPDTTPASPPPKKVATATPAPATTPSAADTAGMSRQSVIPFSAGSSTPAASDVNAIHGLAGKLTAALTAGASRVQLQAYGGPRGDKSSDSRRISLKRALVIRELLIEDGVPSEKIDVRAMGGADDSGALDRVDIFLRS